MCRNGAVALYMYIYIYSKISPVFIDIYIYTYTSLSLSLFLLSFPLSVTEAEYQCWGPSAYRFARPCFFLGEISDPLRHVFFSRRGNFGWKDRKNFIQDPHQIHQLQSPIFLPRPYHHLPDPCGFFGRLLALPRLAKWFGHLWSVEVVDVINASKKNLRETWHAFFRDDSTIKGGFNRYVDCHGSFVILSCSYVGCFGW